MIKEWYDMGKEKRDECGMKGHEFVNHKDIMMSGKMMSENFIKQMDKAFEMWKPKKRFKMHKA